MIKSREAGVVKSTSYGLVVADATALERLSEDLKITEAEVAKKYGFVWAPSGPGRLGVDICEAVHASGLVYECVVVGIYPESFQRLLGKDEMSFDEYLKFKYGDGPYSDEERHAVHMSYADYVLRRTDRRNDDLDAFFGKTEARGEYGEVIDEQA